MTSRIHLFSAALLLAGCSSAAQVSPDTAMIAQDGLQTANGFDSASPDNSGLDGAPPLAPVLAPPVVAFAPVPLATVAVVKPVVVKRVQKLTCDIEVARTLRGIRVTPIVNSNLPLSGEFSLTITKGGADGSSDISQGGEFDARRGERVELSSSEFSLERGARFRAVLKVRAGGNEVCRDVGS